jgi:nucleoid-associated protein YgaU
MRVALLTTAIVLLVLVWTWQDRIPGRVAGWFGVGPDAAAIDPPAMAGEPDVAAPPPDHAPLQAADTGYETAAENVRPLPRTHTVVAGETLESIAEQYYGDPERADDVREANREALGGEETLPPGTILTLP